jgi:hypothetical protein
MASCQSVTSGLIKVAGEFVNKYQDFRKEAAKVFIDTIIPGKAGSEKDLDKLIDQAVELQNDLLGAYGKMAGEGKGKIGPRHLIIPTVKADGSLIATERTFEVAPSLFDNVTVTIKKTGGKAGADIVACAKYATGEHYDTKNERTIEKGKDSEGDQVVFEFTNMANKILTIHLVHKGFPTDKFEYFVKLEGKFDKAQLQKIGKEKLAA